MSEEFQESEVIFSDESFTRKDNKSHNNENYERKSTEKDKLFSSPVIIPARTIFRCTEDVEEEGEMTPPHVIIEKRRTEAQMAFSFCTLKGRDLSRHRNTVLRMTGFLEV
ncbi:Senescence regulator S40 [Arabidopsis suecica]|uniref:Senescence regulator S40 n=1 Tax=Arabidopsis suecica TaxID=45249 RepID=A0A8T1YLX3_ARASU|nr:Senescence regulator S40 [Arabidopsis suecica]